MPLSILLIHLTITLLFDLAWASGLWMNWPERIYQKTKDNRLLWSWMPACTLAKTEKNCASSIRVFCVFQLVVTTLTALFRIILYPH
jgi:hypothetical protein